MTACPLPVAVSAIDGATAYRVRAVCVCDAVPRVIEWHAPTRAAARRLARDLRARHAWGVMPA